MTPVLYLAASETSGGLLGALGINWGALVLNGLAFLIILGILSYFVYPSLGRALDAKAEELKAAAQAQAAAEAELATARKQASQLVRQARADAEQLVTSARAEGTTLVDEAKAKATVQSERILADGHQQLDRDVTNVRGQLRDETLRLVAQASEKVLGEKLTSDRDADLIKRSLETSR